jgi:hypothetical protein
MSKFLTGHFFKRKQLRKLDESKHLGAPTKFVYMGKVNVGAVSAKKWAIYR